MTESARPPALFALSSDHAAAILATMVFVALGLSRDVVGSVEFSWMAVSAQIGPGRAGGDASLVPHLLWALHWVMGDVMWAGRALGVLSAVSIVVFSTRLFGPWAGLWAMAQLPILFGVVLADPALPAVALLMGSLSFGRRGRSGLAGVCGALAVGLGPWILPPALLAVWMSHRRWRALTIGSFLGGMLFWLGVPMVPEFALSLESDVIVEQFQSDWVLILGAAALVWGLMRRSRPSRLLMSVVLSSALGAVLIPSSPDTLVHLQLLVALGVSAVETGPALLLLALITLGIRLPGAYTPTLEDGGRAQVISAMSGRQGKALCTTPTFVRVSDDGWLRPCVQLVSLGKAPSLWRPDDVLAAMTGTGARWVAVDSAAVLSSYFNLQSFLQEDPPGGFSRVASGPGWQVFSLESDPRLGP